MKKQNQQCTPRVLTSKALLNIIAGLKMYQASIVDRVEISNVRTAIGWISRLEQWFFLHDDDSVRELNAEFLADSIHRKAAGYVRSPLLDTPASRAVDRAKDVLHRYVCGAVSLDAEQDFERAYLSY